MILNHLILKYILFTACTIFINLANAATIYNDNTTLETVTLQLQWKHQFEFAGFYAAIYKGLYAKYGIHIKLKEYQSGIDILKEVLSGRAQYGLYHGGIVQARLEGKPLVLLTNYFKRFPLVILAKPPIRTLADLKNKRLMVSNKDLDSPLYKLAFAHEKLVPEKNITIVPHSFDTEPFIRNEVNAMSAYLSNEPFYLEQRGVAFNIIDLSDYMRSMGDMYLFTSETQAKQRPHLTQDLIKATNEGWQYALEHKTEIVDLILSKYSQRKSREALLYEAEKTHELIMPLPLPIGAVFEDVIQDIANFFKQQSSIAYPGNLTNFIFNYLSPLKLNVTIEDRIYLNSITIWRALADGRQPFNFKDNNGKIVGIAEDYWQLIRAKLGLNERTSDIISIADVPAAIQNNMANLHPNIIRKEEYASYAVFSDAYEDYPIAIATRKNEGFISNTSVLEGGIVAVGINYNAYHLLKEKYPHIQFLQVKDTAAALQQVVDGNAFAAVDILPVLQYQITQLGNNEIALAGISEIKYPLQIMLRKEYARLLPLINRAIANITPQERLEINKKWLLRDVIITVDYTYLWQLIILASFIISIILYWNFRLTSEITNRKYIEEQLRKLSRAIEQSHNTVVITNLCGNIEFVNPAFTKVTGYTIQEAIGQNPRILHSGYHNTDFYLNMWNKLTHGQVWKGEILNKSKNGELYWENATISPIKDHAGLTTHYVAIKENISSRKLAEQSAQEHLKRLDEAQRIAKIGSWYIDIVTNTLTWSAQTYRMFGIANGTKIYLNDFLNRVYPLDKFKVQSMWQAAQAGVPYELEHRIIANGQIYWVIERAELQFDDNGKAITGIGTIQDITEHKLIEEALRSSQAQYQRLVDDIGPKFVIYSYRTDNDVIQYVSKGVITVFGITPSNTIGQTWSNVINWKPDSLYRGIEINKKFITGEWDKAESEMEFIHPNGSLRIVAVTEHAVRNDNDNYIINEGIVEDITERKHIQRHIEEQRRTLQAVLENIPAGIQVFTADGKVILSNPHAESLLGNQIIDDTSIMELNRKYSAFIYGTDIPYPYEKRPAVRGLLGEISIIEDMELRHPDGSYILLQVRGAPIPDVNGNINASVVIFHDITKHKEIERILQLNEARLDTLLELSRNAPNMTEEELFRAGQETAEKLTSSVISYMHFVNPDQETVHLGFWSQATMSQCQVETDYHYPLYKAGIWADSVRKKQALIYNDYQNINERKGYPEGHTHILRFMNAPIIEDGEVKMIIGVGNKISPYDEYDLRQLQLIAEDLWHIIIRRRTEFELKAARQAAEAASHAKSTFIAHISHELRTPLTGILGFAQLLLMDKTLTDNHRDYIHTIQKSGEHLLNLINEILDLARIGSGKLELNPSPVRLLFILEEAIAITKVRADNKGLSLSLDCNQLPEAILVDALRLNQILLNLIGNAIKFTKQGEVKLWIKSQPAVELTDAVKLDFAVLDTGSGIPADRIHYVLQPFERLANQTSEGAGLGLSISNALINKMGGKLNLGSQMDSGLWAATAENVPPIAITSNHGTIAWFSLVVPISLNAPLPQEHVVAITGIRGKIPNILVVDDRIEDRAVLVKLLELLGIKAREAIDGVTALVAIREQRPDAIITDLRMPEMDGMELIRRIRNDPCLRDLVIISVSASATLDVKKQNSFIKSDAFLAKPIIAEDLYLVLQSQLGFELIYADVTSSTTNEKILAPTDIPGLSSLHQAIRFTKAGNVAELQKFCNNMQPNYPKFITLIKNYLEQFQLNELKVFLNNLEKRL